MIVKKNIFNRHKSLVIEWKGEKILRHKGEILHLFRQGVFHISTRFVFSQQSNNRIISRFSVSNVVTYNWVGGVKY